MALEEAFEEITCRRGEASFSIAPARGGLVTSLVLGGTEVLYLERGTFEDPTKNVRGGIPLLFPINGPLQDDQYRLGESTYRMKQHGFARNLPWTVIDQDRADGWITLALDATDATRQQYPFDFHLEYTWRLADDRLRLEQRFENRGEQSMPFSCGLHPYFAAANKSAVQLEVPATQVSPNPAGPVCPFSGSIDWNAEAVDLCFVDMQIARASACDPGSGRRILVEASDAYRYFVFWTLRDKPFYCLEPWTARGHAFNERRDLLDVEPGASLSLWVEIGLTDVA
jgi:galactose mutarotase-like enzyme